MSVCFWSCVLTWITRSSNWRTREFPTNRTQSLLSESTVLKSHESSMTITESKATATTCIDLYQPLKYNIQVLTIEMTGRKS